MDSRSTVWTGIYALALLIAAGPAGFVVPGLGSVLLLASLATGAVCVMRAWRSHDWRRAQLLGLVCSLVAGGLLMRTILLSAGLESIRMPLDVDGQTRWYRLYRPPEATSGEPRPVVIALHGLMQRAATMERLTSLDRVAARHGFLVVYPEGYRRSWNDTDPLKPATRAGIDDVGFIAAVLDDVIARHDGDPRRLYVVGFSNGGFLTLRLACKLSVRLAAVAVVAAGTNGAFPPSCPLAAPVPALFILGTGDPLVPWRSFGGSGASWAKRLGCSGTVTSLQVADTADDGTTSRVARYSECSEAAEVVAITIENGGHTWPGGWQYLPRFLVGPTSRDVDASTEIWDFLRRHARGDP